MSRYLLDTNILVFLVSSEFDQLSENTKLIIEDYNNELFLSSVSVLEILQLFHIGKIKPKKYKTANELYECIENEFYIKILPFAKEHLNTLSKLKIAFGHNDPFDHSIISHAITEKLNLISSDKKFKEYTSQNLQFSYNIR